MIKLLIKFLIGFVIGSIIIFVVMYGAGSALEYYGVILYESESDQQRNFNIAIFSWLLFSSISGYLSAKLNTKSNKSN